MEPASKQTTRLFCGNIPYQVNEPELAACFAGVATVVAAEIARDRFTRESRGFGWVDLDANTDVQAVIARMDRFVCRTRPLHVSIARPLRNSSRPLLRW